MTTRFKLKKMFEMSSKVNFSKNHLRAFSKKKIMIFFETDEKHLDFKNVLKLSQ